MGVFLGIDEAGRGPVLGPLVIAGVGFEKDGLDVLVNMGIKDSKKLTKAKRTFFYNYIMDEAYFISTKVIWPKTVDEYVENSKLNLLESEVMSSIISSCGDYNIYIDSPEKPEKFLKMLKTDKNVVCSFKADELFPIVSAASVVAKYTRDSIIEELKKEYGDFGSGYPSDKKTIDYLSTVIKEPPFFVRKSWKTFTEHRCK